jgi:hypothetical protein
MMKSILLLWCYLGTAFCLFSQSDNNPARLFLAQKDTVAVGDTLVLQVYAANFTQLDVLELSVRFPRNVLEWIGPALPPGAPRATIFRAALLNENSNLLKVGWEDFAPPQGATITDSLVILELRFKTLQPTIGNEFAALVNFPNSIRAFNVAGQAIPILDGNVTWNELITILPTESVHLALPDTVVAPGKPFCRKVQVMFLDTTLISLQFSVAWNAGLIRFDSVTNLQIPDLSLGRDFNLLQVAQGKLSVAWVDLMLRGVDFTPGAVFFELCFTALDTVGTTAIQFTQSPTDIEFYRVDGKTLRFYGTPADITLTRNPLMRPGDTNADGIVNNFDLLPIGLAYGNTGIDRQNATTRWQAQPAADWAQTAPQSQVNYKHFDSDGNGLIELLDARAIDTNYNQKVTGFVPPLRSEPREQGAPLYVQTGRVRPGEQARFNLVLGEAAQPATDVYGVAFSIEYDDLLAVGNTDRVAVTFDTTWLGKVGEDLLVLQKNNPSEQRIDVALVRTDGRNRTGFGTIGQLRFDVPIWVGEDPIPSVLDTLGFRISKVRLLNFSEIEQAVSAMETIALVSFSTGINDPALAQKIRLFPNPVHDRLFIQTDHLQIERLDIFDTTGKLLQSRSNAPEILTSELAAGIYAVRIFTKEGVVVKTFVVK